MSIRPIKQKAFALVNTLLISSLFLVSSVFAQSTSQSEKTNASQDAKAPGSSSASSSTQGAGQSPLLIIKKNTGVSSVSQGWAIGTQNANTTIKVPTRNLDNGQLVDGTVSVTIKQNPTGSNVKNNVSALTQPPTIVIEQPTCVGGQVLTAGVCACPSGSNWNGSTCVVQVPCVAPPSTSTTQSCTTYYGSPSWTGNVIFTTTYTCPLPFGPVNINTSTDTSNCAPLVLCNSIKPADSSSSQTCASYYSNTNYTGNVYFYTTWSCPTMTGAPVSSSSTDTSQCVLKPITCVPNSTTSSSACVAPFTGGTQVTTTTVTCPSGQYGAPSTSSNTDTSACTMCSNTSESQSAACDAGFSGTKTRTKFTNSCTGSVSYSSWDTSSCVGCSQIEGSQTSACTSGVGTRTRTTYTNSCTGAVSYGSWDTSGCSTCYDNETYENASCGAGYTGSSYKSRLVRTNSCTGAVSYGSWDTSTCESCSSSTSTETSSCPFAGTRTRTVTTNSCSGTSYGAWDSSGCSCPGTEVSYGVCPAPQSGTTVITKTYSGASCTASTSTDTSGCVSCSNVVTTESGTCPVGTSGSTIRTVTTNSCTGVSTYGPWNSSNCIPDEPITYTTVDFFSFDSVDPSRCSFQVWIFGYKSGKKVSESLQSISQGYVENGTCILY